jgi:hypothetical protein
MYNPKFRIIHTNDEKEFTYDTDYEKYIRLLEFDPERDVYEEHGALFVNAVYTGEINGAVGYHRAETGKPPWIENPPAEIGGFPCAVGVADARLSHKDTVIASYEDAACVFVKNSFSRIYVSEQTDENTLLDNSFILFSGIVKGFYVLETWTDPKSGTVWTLAAAREVIRKTEES